MGKQGVMVFHVDIGNMSVQRASEYIGRMKEVMVENEHQELSENYDFIFLPGRRDTDNSGTEIEIFPYKDYKLNIENMTNSEIETYLDAQLLLKLKT